MSGVCGFLEMEEVVQLLLLFFFSVVFFVSFFWGGGFTTGNLAVYSKHAVKMLLHLLA